ncbi:hypothetical protein [Weissella koreensis]|uniref:Uncharacterized protein n=1 Tax=Weissella koreensis TaxID=165096 RepID=A0A7H1MKL0_9LACO|nr:hypothetical protein [Weissella koreensis]AVH74793.1 hypothetical protein C4597_01635 [Weissella koreensis]QGN20018.1 hypothetical protein GKC51_01610 [Weissella koreensis]QNT63996.1 hypothetical protein FY536_01335 [Weissella koreensis]
MRNKMKIVLIILGVWLGAGLYGNNQVEASITNTNNVYHITTGADLVSLIGATNIAGYWSITNPAPSSLSISVDKDITIPDINLGVNSNIKNLDIDFNNHMYYVKNRISSSFIMSNLQPSLNVTLHNIKSSSEYTSATNGDATVPDPTNETGKTSGYLLSYYSLFRGDWSIVPSNFSGSLTYDNVSINYPNLSDAGAQMFSAYYVPLRFTGQNNFNIKGTSTQEFAEISDLTVVNGKTAMTWGSGGGNDGMFSVAYTGRNTSNISVNTGATWEVNNNAKKNILYYGRGITTNTVNITNNGTMNWNNLGYSNSETPAANSVWGGVILPTTTNINLGNNAVTNFISNISVLNPQSMGKLTLTAQNGSQTILKTNNTSTNVNQRVINGNGASGSKINLNAVKLFSMQGQTIPPVQANNLILDLGTTSPLTIKGFQNNELNSLFVAELGSIAGDWKTNDQMNPKISGNSYLSNLQNATRVDIQPGEINNTNQVKPSNWVYQLADSIFPNDKSKVWLPRNGATDNQQVFSVFDSRAQQHNFTLQASVSGDPEHQYGFKKNGSADVINLGSGAQNIIQGADFNAGTNGDPNSAGKLTYTTDAEHGLLVQSSKSDKAGVFNGTVTYTLVDGGIE